MSASPATSQFVARHGQEALDRLCEAADDQLGHCRLSDLLRTLTTAPLWARLGDGSSKQLRAGLYAIREEMSVYLAIKYDARARKNEAIDIWAIQAEDVDVLVTARAPMGTRSGPRADPTSSRR